MHNVKWKKTVCPAGHLFWFALVIALLLASGGLQARLGMEWSHRVAAIVVDYKDITQIAREEGVSRTALYPRLFERGVRGVTIAEYTGKDLLAGAMSLTFGPLASVPHAFKAGTALPPDRGAILIDNADPLLPNVISYLNLRMSGLEIRRVAYQTLIVLPATVEELADSGMLPDFAALDFVRRVETAALFRPAPSAGVDGQKVAASLRWLKEKYPRIECIIPAGLILAGYPDVAPLASALRETGIKMAQVEFVRQIGVAQLSAAVKANVLPLHSLARDELIARRMTREQIVERMVRAVHERSVRLLLMRPYDLYSAHKLEPFLEDISRIRTSLNARGYAAGWPSPLPLRGASLPGALSIAAVFAACAWFYLRRYSGSLARNVSVAECAALGVCTLIFGIAIWKAPFVSRLAGGATAALCATEAAIWALDRYRKPFAGVVAGFLIVLAGGFCIAGFYGTTSAMLRLAPFSGVKLTLLLPPLLILANDLKTRVHPESLTGILERPPLWGELLLCALLLGGALLMAVRSDNVAFVPGWEIRFRDALERLLWVRPRTKEFLFGYPCLILYYAFARRGWAARWREVLRIGASLAFASALNTFCHFHTLLPITAARVANGWWLGILIGLIAVAVVDYIGVPFWRRAGREIFD